MKDRPADEQIMVWVDELIAEAEAERDPEEVAEIRRENFGKENPPGRDPLQVHPRTS